MFWSRSFVVIVFVDGAVASSVERVSGVTIDGSVEGEKMCK